MQQQLQAETFKFNAQVETGGRDVRADAETLGVAFDPATASNAALQAKNIEAAEEAIAEAATKTQDYADAQTRLKTLGGAAWDALRNDADLYIGKQIVAEEAALSFNQALKKSLLLFAQGEGPANQYSDAVRDAMVKSQGPLRTFVKELEGMKERLDAQELIPDAEISDFQGRLKSALAAGNVSAEQKGAVEGLFNLVRQTQGALNNLKTAAKDLEKVQPKLPVAEALVNPLEDSARAAKVIGDGMTTAKNSLEGASTTLNDLLNPALNQTSDAANNAATATTSIGTNAQASVAGINAATAAMTKLKNEAIAAARASAAASSGGALPAAAGGMQYFARGGLGRLASFPRGVDNIPAMLKRGEFVMNDKSSRRFYSELNAMNQGVKPIHRSEGGSVTTVGDVHVTVQGGDNSRQTVREIGHALQRELRRGTINLGQLRRR